MAYFTTILQRQIDSEWRKRIEKADSQMRLCTSGKEIRDFLNNRQTLSTVGFVIRRYIQQTMPFLLDRISQNLNLTYADLTKNLNIAWPDEFITVLAGELAKLSRHRGISISKSTWKSYLSDTPSRMYKDTPFKVAFALSMPVNITEELLMASGQDTYCFRRPDHFIYYYCQNRFSAYNWEHAQSLLTQYTQRIQAQNYTANDATVGMTHILRKDLKNLFNSCKPDSEADHDLLRYMHDNQKEFSGLSLTARKDFLRMAEYLAALYPTYTKFNPVRNPQTNKIETTSEELPVTIDENGVPQLAELVRALFSTGGWLPTTIGKHDAVVNGAASRTASSRKRRKSSSNIEYHRAEIDEETDRPFLNSVQYFVDSYAHHLDAIDRVYRRPANPGNVDRRDIILFTYFFIRKYPELLEDEDFYGPQLDHLTQLAYSDTSIDRSMDTMMEQLYNLSNTDIDSVQRSNGYLAIFNSILQHFGMKEMYMPNTWDRFIYMSLYAEDPDFFTEAVLWNTICDEDDTESIVPDTGIESQDITEKLVRHVVNDLVIPKGLLFQGNQTATAVHPAYLHRESDNSYNLIDRFGYVFGRQGMHASEQQNYGFVTSDRTISRIHAMILFVNSRYYLADLSTYQATWLNDLHLESATVDFRSADGIHVSRAYLLTDQDKIRLGCETFIFLE